MNNKEQKASAIDYAWLITIGLILLALITGCSECPRVAGVQPSPTPTPTTQPDEEPIEEDEATYARRILSGGVYEVLCDSDNAILPGLDAAGERLGFEVNSDASRVDLFIEYFNQPDCSGPSVGRVISRAILYIYNLDGGVAADRIPYATLFQSNDDALTALLNGLVINGFTDWQTGVAHNLPTHDFAGVDLSGLLTPSYSMIQVGEDYIIPAIGDGLSPDDRATELDFENPIYKVQP